MATPEDLSVLTAEPLDPEQAHQLETARRRLEPQETAALNRHRLLRRWGLLESDSPTMATDGGLALLKSDREGLWDQLRLGWLLTDPDAAAMVPEHDWEQIVALDPTGREPFAPDRLRVTDGSRLTAFVALGIPALLERFAAGELIAANDPAVLQLHTMATTHRRQLRAATGLSPGKLATGTLRTLLRGCGWRLERAGRIHTRDSDRGVLAYRAAPVALPAGVAQSALIAVWRRGLQQVELRTAYNAEFNRMRSFGEIRPGIYHRRAATIRAAIYVVLPDEPLLCKGAELEMARQDERYNIRQKLFELVHALESWQEQADA